MSDPYCIGCGEQARAAHAVPPRRATRAGEDPDVGIPAFPPRLAPQPIFYPVLTEEYARKIARDWNATRAETGYTGFVTRFRVNAEYASRFEIQTVGASWHKELWVLAEELEEFNANIVGLIEVIVEYRGGPDHEPVEVSRP